MSKGFKISIAGVFAIAEFVLSVFLFKEWQGIGWNWFVEMCTVRPSCYDNVCLEVIVRECGVSYTKIGVLIGIFVFLFVLNYLFMQLVTRKKKK